jgi:predicted nucleic acid-binding protein
LGELVADILIIPYQHYLNETAISITKQLKLKRKTIEYKDLLIAATALHFNYSLATINEKHFKDIDGLHLITPSSFQP